MTVGLVQLNSRDDKAANLDAAERLIAAAAARGAHLVALPEYVTYLGPKERHVEQAEPIPGPTTDRFAGLARQHRIWLLDGSIHETSEFDGLFYNTSVLFDPMGEIVATYRKIHLYDVELTGNVSANESATIKPGRDVVTADVDGHRLGMSICYDLRFPELYRLLALDGAEMLAVPAAFTMFTGQDHWHSLLKARAIENQCYVIAPAQVGRHEPNAQCYGHSVVIDPWGTVLVDASNREGFVTAELDFDDLREVRAQLPSLANRRPEAYQGRRASLALA
ncbi:MAG: carbon-nitrogen hydrolase family protein [Thermomicrobiales bacterium]